MSAKHLATIGILSIGDMGMGVARLLISQGYRVVTNLEGRSQSTHTRVSKSSIEALPTDISLVQQSDYILSIVPPRDALSTARRIAVALTNTPPPRTTPLYYLDLNAISPRSAREIAALFTKETPSLVKFVDGGILGAPPSLKPSSSTTKPDPSDIASWKRPSIPLSGPDPLPSPHLLATLNSSHLTSLIGSASGLKTCFSTTTKGFTALCIQAFTTAQNLGVLEELKKEMEVFNPEMLKFGVHGVTSMPPKAYRWEAEMREIAACHQEDGRFMGREGSVFGEVAEIYRTVADDTVLGKEKTENRKRGRTVEDVATAMNEGLIEKRRRENYRD